MRVSIVVPCYNEAESIGRVLSAIPKNKETEILVVDNNSTDATADIARAAGAIIVSEPQRGYGSALKAGFREATGDIIVTLDGDGQYPAEMILKLVSRLEEKNLDFISGNRFPLDDNRSMPFLRVFGNKFLSFCCRMLFGVKLHDSQSGMWVFRKSVLDHIILTDDSMALSEEIKLKTLLCPTLQFEERHIPYRLRTGESKLSVVSHGWKNLSFLILLYFRTAPRLFIHDAPKQKNTHSVAYLFLIILIYLAFSLPTIGTPFMRVSEDTNGYHGVASQNTVRFNPLQLKFGITTNWVAGPSDAVFYTHHPAGFIWPTVISYALFGVSEASTRAGPLAITLVGIIFFFFALQKLFKHPLPAALVALVFVVLPGTVYYGKHLDVQQPALGLSLVTFSLFALHYFSLKKTYFYFFLFSLIVGALSSWWYYFLPALIFFFLLGTKAGRNSPEQKKYLLFIPLLLISGFLANLGHFYLLKGSEAFTDLWQSFLTRTSRVPFQIWLSRSIAMAKLMFTPPFLITAFLGLIVYCVEYKKREWSPFLLPLIVSPFFIVALFFDWSTHPFGLMFFLPTIAIISTLFFLFLARLLPKHISLTVISVMFLFGFVVAADNTNRYNNWLIVGSQDVSLFKELRNRAKEGVCLGESADGIPYHGIVEWYLESATVSPSQCISKNTKLVLIHNPNLGEFYQQQIKFFINNNFTFIGCAERFCLMEKSAVNTKKDNPLPPQKREKNDKKERVQR